MRKTREFFSLKGKAAVITGGGSGIGLATARRFADAGASVVIANRRNSEQEAKSFDADYFQCDVSIEENVKNLMEFANRRLGKIDILVNSAGFGEVGAEITGLSDELMRKHFDINVFGVFYCLKYGVPFMPDGGSIITITSVASHIGMPTYGAYVSSKWAAAGLMRTAALELAPRRIRVNSLSPGSIDTPINQQAGAEGELELVKALAPLGRIGEPEEVAAAAHFLASDDASYVTGTECIADGGWLAGLSYGTIEKVMR